MSGHLPEKSKQNLGAALPATICQCTISVGPGVHLMQSSVNQNIYLFMENCAAPKDTLSTVFIKYGFMWKTAFF